MAARTRQAAVGRASAAKMAHGQQVRQHIARCVKVAWSLMRVRCSVRLAAKDVSPCPAARIAQCALQEPIPYKDNGLVRVARMVMFRMQTGQLAKSAQRTRLCQSMRKVAVLACWERNLAQVVA
mmetsp:Transcript_83340/g.210101  ORF Transcript_83340/g.210101 Transcript_83340/m.210101 type:complete len:124 (+) Transcript_83340:12-383(+)